MRRHTTGVWRPIAEMEDKLERLVTWAVLSWLVVGTCYLTRAIVGWTVGAAAEADPFQTIFLVLWIVSSVTTLAAAVFTYWSVVFWWSIRRGRVSGQRD